MMTLSDASPEDIPQISRIEGECFSRPWSEEDFSKALRNPDTLFIVAKDEGSLMGYILIYKTYEDASVTNIATDSRYRCQGIANELLAEACIRLSEDCVEKLFLEVRESNECAINVYKRAGFEYVSKRKRFYRDPEEDALIFRKEIKI